MTIYRVNENAQNDHKTNQSKYIKHCKFKSKSNSEIFGFKKLFWNKNKNILIPANQAEDKAEGLQIISG